MVPRIFLIIVVLMLFASGCASAIDPVSPNEAGAVANNAGNHSLWGYYNVDIDPDTMEIDLVPSRTTNGHVNITTLVSPPKCLDCLTMEVTESDPVLRMFKIKVTLKNKTAITAYDVRGIVLPKVDGITVINADGYTTLWNGDAFDDRNPYRTFAHGIPNHAFYPEFWDSREYKISYGDPQDLGKISYAIDVAWPDNCTDPYEILIPDEDPVFYGPNSGEILVEVRDWQDDIEYVRLFPFPLTLANPDAYINLTNTSGDYWSTLTSNTNELSPGSYFVWIQAKSYGTSVFTWQRMRINVETDKPPPSEFITVPVTYYVAVDSGGKVPEYVYPSGTHIPFNLQIVASQIAWANQVWNRYGFMLTDTDSYYIMDDNPSTDWKYFFLDSGTETMAMHDAYGKAKTPDTLNMYFVQTLPMGGDTAFCAWPSWVTSLGEHKSDVVFHVYSPNVWYWEEVMAHESGHAFGAFNDIYLLYPPIGLDCAFLNATNPPQFQHLYCDDTAYYAGNLMYYSMGWSVTQYSLTGGQVDFATNFNNNYPNNWQ